VQLLLEYKADVTIKNTYDQSPLDHAVDNMNSDVVTVMLKNKGYVRKEVSNYDYEALVSEVVK